MSSEEKMLKSSLQSEVRVFGYTQSRQLTQEELASVSGGLAASSWCDTGLSCAMDDSCGCG